MSNSILEDVDYFRAGENWCSCREDFEAPSNGRMPVLSSYDRFKAFSMGYSVPHRRTSDFKRLRDCFEWLGGQIGDFDRPDCLANAWQDAGVFKNHQLSLASKLFAFMSPEKYVAIDSFAKIGLAKLDNGTARPKTYRKYLERINDLASVLNSEMSLLLTGKYIPTVENQAFRLRVLDCALMRHGHRWN